MERRLAAIMAADVVGYSRLIRADEEGTIAALMALRADLIDPRIAEHNGRIVKLMGDGMLAEFPSVVDAMRAAVETQRAVAERNADLPEEKRIEFRVGINLGDVVIDGDDIQGDGINVAARLEGLAEPGGICVSGSVHEQVRDKVDIAFEDLGEQEVKNIDRPVQVWRWVKDDKVACAGPLRASEPLPLPRKPSVVVLPFENMSGDPEQEYFSDGISEDIITGLSQMRGIFVIARNSAFTYKGRGVDVKRVGLDLGVRYVLEGSVRRSGNRIRVTAQLIDADTGIHVWADRYDGTIEDVFALQDEITANVITAVGPEITLAEIQRARGKRSESFDAWDRYLQALQGFYAVNKAGYEEATALLEEAIELDPRFSTAYATLARCHAYAGFHGWGHSAHEVIAKAEEFARQSVALDENDPFGHLALGQVLIFNSDPGRAVNELKRALELSPNLSIAHELLSNALAFLGRSEEALAAAERANRGSPRDPERYVWYVGVPTAAKFLWSASWYGHGLAVPWTRRRSQTGDRKSSRTDAETYAQGHGPQPDVCARVRCDTGAGRLAPSRPAGMTAQGQHETFGITVGAHSFLCHLRVRDLE
ncbi:MAG: adenylate/guanylate cyclase domain-containing protein [Planctomycetota bacterium]|jgi:adenylate cyclase